MGRWYTPFAYTSGFVLSDDEVFDLAKDLGFDFVPSPSAHKLDVAICLHNASRSISLYMASKDEHLKPYNLQGVLLGQPSPDCWNPPGCFIIPTIRNYKKNDTDPETDENTQKVKAAILGVETPHHPCWHTSPPVSRSPTGPDSGIRLKVPPFENTFKAQVHSRDSGEDDEDMDDNVEELAARIEKLKNGCRLHLKNRKSGKYVPPSHPLSGTPAQSSEDDGEDDDIQWLGTLSHNIGGPEHPEPPVGAPVQSSEDDSEEDDIQWLGTSSDNSEGPEHPDPPNTSATHTILEEPVILPRKRRLSEIYSGPESSARGALRNVKRKLLEDTDEETRTAYTKEYR
ncbi:hypothetical protein RHS01_03162 [Rhizoctonia solani]|uniref:Uncharacterized protein n=1 Tax=Rhizoctonia solani TaxID=456999 RepID=A0A8H7IM53_9AGAM|nr:hypothetical protein RHS01_03162 [Rhizoctonia solani]